MAKRGAKKQECSVVIYHSPADNCWIAHSLDTDQIGTGSRIVDALADLIRAVNAVYRLASQDPNVAYFRKAPPEIFRKVRRARLLPREVYEIAYKMVNGDWPKELALEVAPDESQPPLFKSHLQPAGI